MPYNPGVTFNPGPIMQGTALAIQALQAGGAQAGNAIAAGLQNLGQGVSGAVKEKKMTAEELDMLGGTVSMLANDGLLDAGEFEKFQTGSIGTKRAIVSQGLTRQKQVFAEDLAQLHNRAANQANTALNLTAEDLANYTKAGYIPLRTSQRSFQAVPDAAVAATQTNVNTVTDDAGNAIGVRDPRTGKIHYNRQPSAVDQLLAQTLGKGAGQGGAAPAAGAPAAPKPGRVVIDGITVPSFLQQTMMNLNPQQPRAAVNPALQVGGVQVGGGAAPLQVGGVQVGGPAPAAAAPAAPEASAAAPIKINSKEEFNKLQSGDLFEWNGKILQKK